MESIIKTIVDMDKRARKRTMEEQEFFDKADSELAEQAKKIQAEEQLSLIHISEPTRP